MISSGHQRGLVCVCHQLPAKQALQASCVLLGQYELIQGRCVFTMSYLSGQWLLINLAQLKLGHMMQGSSVLVNGEEANKSSQNPQRNA